jgi:hypothetical protein
MRRAIKNILVAVLLVFFIFSCKRAHISPAPITEIYFGTPTITATIDLVNSKTITATITETVFATPTITPTLYACVPGCIAFDLVDYGSDSGGSVSPSFVVISNPAAWTFTDIPVDFNTEMAVIIYGGQKPTFGYYVGVLNVNTASCSSVEINACIKAPTGLVPTSIAYPYSVIIMPKIYLPITVNWVSCEIDTDGDGVRDYDEDVAGTDPCNPASKPACINGWTTLDEPNKFFSETGGAAVTQAVVLKNQIDWNNFRTAGGLPAGLFGTLDFTNWYLIAVSMGARNFSGHSVDITGARADCGTGTLKVNVDFIESCDLGATAVTTNPVCIIPASRWALLDLPVQIIDSPSLDTDGDGYWDHCEQGVFGTDPLNPADHPNETVTPISSPIFSATVVPAGFCTPVDTYTSVIYFTGNFDPNTPRNPVCATDPTPAAVPVVLPSNYSPSQRVVSGFSTAPALSQIQAASLPGGTLNPGTCYYFQVDPSNHFSAMVSPDVAVSVYATDVIGNTKQFTFWFFQHGCDTAVPDSNPYVPVWDWYVFDTTINPPNHSNCLDGTNISSDIDAYNGRYAQSCIWFNSAVGSLASDGNYWFLGFDVGTARQINSAMNYCSYVRYYGPGIVIRDPAYGYDAYHNPNSWYFFLCFGTPNSWQMDTGLSSEDGFLRINTPGGGNTLPDTLGLGQRDGVTGDAGAGNFLNATAISF